MSNESKGEEAEKNSSIEEWKEPHDENIQFHSFEMENEFFLCARIVSSSFVFELLRMNVGAHWKGVTDGHVGGKNNNFFVISAQMKTTERISDK